MFFGKRVVGQGPPKCQACKSLISWKPLVTSSMRVPQEFREFRELLPLWEVQWEPLDRNWPQVASSSGVSEEETSREFQFGVGR